MKGYLGEFTVDTSTDENFKNMNPNDWAMRFIEMYGQIDGSHHKAWVLDTVARILKGTPVRVTEARWENGHTEFRYRLDTPSGEYLEWVAAMRMDDGDECEISFEYDEGVAP